MTSSMDHPVSATATTGIVLAGGKSSRMGRPKALLPFDGQPLIAHIVATLRPLCAEIVVVAAPDQELPAMPVTVVRDAVAYQGPVGGITYGLTASTMGVSFVTSCDSAFLNPELIAHLVSRIGGYDVVVPHWLGRFQPLHAVYRRSVLPLLEAQLARGELRPVLLFDKVRTRTVDEEEIRRIDPDGASFFNMNTPEDYEEAFTQWEYLRRREREGREYVSCIVELFGVARMVARTTEVALVLRERATLVDVYAALAEKLPALRGRVISVGAPRLMDGYACNINGRAFVSTPETPVHAGDSLVILSADPGG